MLARSIIQKIAFSIGIISGNTTAVLHCSQAGASFFAIFLFGVIGLFLFGSLARSFGFSFLGFFVLGFALCQRFRCRDSAGRHDLRRGRYIDYRNGAGISGRRLIGIMYLTLIIHPFIDRAVSIGAETNFITL